MTRSGSEPAVAGQERGVECLSERYVHGTICGKGGTELPNTSNQKIMWIATQRQTVEVLEGFPPSLRGDGLLSDITSKHLSHFDVEEMRNVQGLRNRENPLINFDSGGRLKQPLNGSGRIQDNHRESRSRRTASAADTAPVTPERRRKRSRSSAMLGRSATRRISANRKSERDIPAKAAYDLRVRCRLSGTLRTWIIRDMWQT